MNMQKKENIKRTKSVTIKKGWYWTAGKTYHWGPEVSTIGVGLNRVLFSDSDEIRVTVVEKDGTKNIYLLDTKVGLEFIRKNKSHKKFTRSLVGFVPKSLLSKVEVEQKPCKHKWEEDEMFASGAIMIISGNPNCLGEETKLVCEKCGEEKYVPKNIMEQTTLLDLLK